MRRPSLRGLSVLAVPLAAVFLTVAPSSAATLPTAGGIYQLKVTKSGMCIDVPGASSANGALLQQWGCTGNATWQQFKLVASGSNFLLQNVSSGRCVDVPGTSTASGVQLQQWGCASGQTNQQWRLAASGTDTFQIINVGSGLCVSDKDASTSSGAAIIQETCTANSNKQWAFTPVGATGPATVAKDGTGQYSTVQAAVDAVPAGNTTRRVITIKPGTYREIVTVPSNKPYVTLQGLGAAASQTVIVNNRSSAGGYGTSGSATAFLDGHDFAATNLTFSNDYGEGSQAVAVNLNADRSVFDNVRFLGNQDTFLVNNNRSYVKNSYVEGTVDFIFGGATTVFHNSTIHEKRSSGGPITAASTDAAKTYGLLFYKCTITGAANNVTQLGRPWRPNAQVLYRESNLSATIKTAQPWTDMSGNSWKNARFLEYKNTGSGAGANSNRPQLSDAQAATYTPQRYLAGSDGWNPVG
ncbi:pectinesterase family protein [Actinoplanes sp. TRM 88003]|uniref:Pectinesterase n=1 Tax=Paractinoplanes aksuensis TaxID=2939490 RepID=A0ABT1DS30_9ACTN|nr:pectinesterase family protein [Actinoplanes aksuensis]MCO8272815.1 pectinesterase family protein [Actinoplanes aksuensis]